MQKNISTKSNELTAIAPSETIERLILDIRDKQVMLDCDLARLYGVETKVLNQAVKRNAERLPEDFMFQLSNEEFDYYLRSQFVTSSDNLHGGRRYLPYVFTESGFSMLSSVLRSPTAIQVNIYIMRAFVAMRHTLNTNFQLNNRIELLEQNQLSANKLLQEHTEQFELIFDKIFKHEPPTEGVFHDGKIFDAYKFATDLIKSAKKSLVLIDNYVDESVLLMLSKRNAGVLAKIYTSHLSDTLKLDVQKHNMQYPPIEIEKYTKAHDRFLIIDDTDVYHIGASLKDLGKKLFAFSKLNVSPEVIL